ncbi:MAG: DUF2845 domain-containing protein [Gammaproteobacteria bacterium]|nr:DUF2845 domain-containing protein [Gammaproteobacteria bacterium]
MHDIFYKTMAVAILLAYSVDADAYGSLRCKGRIVDVGDSAAEVLALCGEPARRITKQSPVRAGVRGGFTRFAGYTTAEEWIYDRGWGKFPAVLYFDDGKLRRIEHLPKRSEKK